MLSDDELGAFLTWRRSLELAPTIVEAERIDDEPRAAPAALPMNTDRNRRSVRPTDDAL